MERADDDRCWSNAPTDILRLISSRLVAGEHVVFRAVCKSWRRLPPPPQPDHLHDYSSPFSCVDTPCLITLYEEKGDVEFFNPLYNVLITQKMDISELRGSRIRCAIKDWLLMSKGNRGMFFFNPISKVIIKLPDLLEEFENLFPSWTFSCPPDASSSDCFVVGFCMSGFPPAVYMIKVGESRWTLHYFHDEDGNEQRLFFIPHNPVYFKNNTVYVLGWKGNLGILTINGNSTAETPTWKFYGKQLSHRKQSSIRQVFTTADIDNGGMLVVFITHDEGKVDIWRYKMNGEELEKEKITSLENKTLFVSFGTSFLKPCVAQGLGNKIYFPMYHDNNDNKGVFYCLATHKYYSLGYSSPNCFNLVHPISSIWIEPSS